jgi:hypothetical protein
MFGNSSNRKFYMQAILDLQKARFGRQQTRRQRQIQLNSLNHIA